MILRLFARSIAGYPKTRLTRMLMTNGETRLFIKVVSQKRCVEG